MPQSMGDKTEATHDRVMSVQKGRSAVFLALVQGYAPLQVGTGSGQLSQAEKRESQRPVGFDEPGRVLPALGQVEQLLSQFVCRLVLGPRDMKAPQPSQHGEELRRLFKLLTQLPSLRIHCSCFRSGVALGGDQHRPEHGLQNEFLLETFSGGW